MNNIVDESLITDRNYWINKITEIVKPVKTKHTTKKYKYQPFHCILKNAPDEIKKDEELVLLALNKGKALISNVHDDLLNSKEFILKYISQCSNYVSFIAIPKSLQEDEEIFYAGYKKDYTCFKYSRCHSNKFWTREHIEKLVQINGQVIEHLSDSYRNDLKIAKMAVDQNLNNIFLLNKKVSSRILVDKEYCKNILDKDSDTLPFMSAKIRGDKELILPYIKNNNALLKYATKKLRNEKEFMSNFLGCHWLASSIGDELKKDEEFMLRAVSLLPATLFYLDDSLRNKEFYLKAVQLNSNCYKNLWEQYQKDEDIISAYLNHEHVFDEKYEKTEPVAFLHPDILFMINQDFGSQPKKDCMGLQEFARNKYLNITLNNNLSNSNESLVKKHKI